MSTDASEGEMVGPHEQVHQGTVGMEFRSWRFISYCLLHGSATEHVWGFNI